MFNLRIKYLSFFFGLITILSFFNVIYSYYLNLYLNLNTYYISLFLSLFIALIFSKIVNPVEVNPDIASKNEFKKLKL